MKFKYVNKLFRFSSSHILLYHSAFKTVPADLIDVIHNVTPDQMYLQLKWLKNNFDVISADKFLSLENCEGKAAITFDDGYKSVFEEALPILKSLNLPCTIFLNGCTLENKVFWRDKVRYLINKSLVSDFIDNNKPFCKMNRLQLNNFYHRTKHKSLNSMKVEYLLDKFFKEKNIDLEPLSYCIDDPFFLKKDDLVSYGNHSYSHYVMSSLTKEEQEKEILKNINLFKKYKIKQSSIFSIPFGDENSFDNNTIALLKQFNYKGFLYSRNRLNSIMKNKFSSTGPNSIYFIDRYMPRHNFFSFKSQIKILNFRKILGFHRVRS